MDAAGAETSLDNLEALTLAQNHVGGGNTDVLERDVAVTVRRIVEAHDRKHAVDDDTGCLGGNKDDGLLLVLIGVVGICLAQDNEDLAARVTNSGGPPFLS